MNGEECIDNVWQDWLTEQDLTSQGYLERKILILNGKESDL